MLVRLWETNNTGRRCILVHTGTVLIENNLIGSIKAGHGPMLPQSG